MFFPSVITKASELLKCAGRFTAAGIVIPLISVAAVFVPLPSISAAQRPSYNDVFEKLPEIWEKRYPVMAEGFEKYTGKYLVLRTTEGKRAVHYYRYFAIIPVMARKEDESVSPRETRKAEFWVRYRSWMKDPYDVTFARHDLLPGSDRRWLQN